VTGFNGYQYREAPLKTEIAVARAATLYDSLARLETSASGRHLGSVIALSRYAGDQEE
jgi:hypothetical protein